MKIVNREEFCGIEKPVLFSYYEPTYFRGLGIKIENMVFGEHTDFVEIDLINSVDADDGKEYVDRIEQMEKGCSGRFDYATGRNGCFDENEKYLVYEVEDIDRLIDLLKEVRRKM